MQYLIGIGGIVLILAIACAFSSNRRWIRLRVVGAAFALQAGLAVLVLDTPWGNPGDRRDVGRRFRPARLCQARASISSSAARSPKARSGRQLRVRGACR